LLHHKTINMYPARFLKFFSVLLVLMATVLTTQAQDTLEKNHNIIIAAQIRPKFEFRYGNFQPLPLGAKPAAFVSQRTRIAFTYHYKNLLSVHIAPQFVSVWGQENLTQGVTPSNALGLFEAWFRLRLTKTTDMKIGRQVISLDDERFFGELDWAQGARAHDAISFNFKKKKGELKAFAAYNQNYRIYGNNLNNVSGNLFSTKDAAPYKWMQTLWGKYSINDKDALSFLFTNLGLQNAPNAADTIKSKTYFLQTGGANYTHNEDKWNMILSAYYQGGKNVVGLKTSAYLLALNVMGKVHKKVSLGFGADYVSGNKVGYTQKTNQAFIPYFGTNHKFYGSMDYYYSGNGHKNAGLFDGYLKLVYKPNTNWTASMAVHQFVAPYAIQNVGRKFSPNLGQEIDWDFGFNINKFTKLMGGYSIYITSPTTLFLKDVPKSKVAQHWLWVSISVTPKFLDYKH
ncbi:MAG TPA: alginate export family protein, partial [Chitinophagales bacterium]|nr:alginate export family protein [Chitinophagales bacterium]